MMNLKEGLALAAGLMLIATAALAESGGPGTFSDLSPGNQKIARALFEAQHPTVNGPQPFSLNQIATLKGHEGWGEVFKQMKAEGLVHEKNLGEVVSSYEHHLHNPSHASSSSGRTIVTTGNGHTFASGSDNGHAQAGKSGDAGSDGVGHGFASAEHGHDVTVSTAGGATGGGASVSSSGGGGSHGVAAGHAH